MLPKYDAKTWAPCTESAAVTPDNTATLGGTSAARGGALLYVGTGGNLTLDLADGGVDIVYKNVPAGTFLPLIVKRVKTATTAADIVANW